MRKKFRTCWGQLCSSCGQIKEFSGFDRQRGKSTGYRSNCKDCRQISYTEQYQNSTARYRKASWAGQGIVGMTPERYEQMLSVQGGCAICGITEAENGRRLCVDHDHSTGEVRALLCDPCNTGLGRFNDDPLLLSRALEYLEEHKMKVAI